MVLGYTPDSDIRYKVVDERLDVLRATLESDVVERELGTARLTRLRALADMLIVPTYENETLGIPETHQNTYDLRTLIPVFPISSGETISNYDTRLTSQHMEQILRTRERLAILGIQQCEQEEILSDTDASLRAVDPDNSFTIGSNRIAVTVAHQVAYSAGQTQQEITVSGRPMILLNTDDSSRDLRDDNPLLHELIHVDQVLREPAIISQDVHFLLRQELEAYHTQHIVNRALGLSSIVAMRIHDLVEYYATKGVPRFTVTSQLQQEVERMQDEHVISHII